MTAAASPAGLVGARKGSGGSPSGYDIGYPQCGRSLPAKASFGIVGANNGIVFSTNPCLSAELTWAQQAANHRPAFYANTADPGPAYSSHWPTGQTSPRWCDPASSRR